MDAQNSDELSVSSVLLDILLQDACSGTGSASSGSGVSAAAESLGSGSNGCGMSGSRTGNSGSQSPPGIAEGFEVLQTPWTASEKLCLYCLLHSLFLISSLLDYTNVFLSRLIYRIELFPSVCKTRIKIFCRYKGIIKRPYFFMFI